MWLLMGLLFSTGFCAVASARITAHESLSFRATFADGRNGLSTCCEPYGGGSVPELSNIARQASGFRQWTNLSNPSDKQLRRLTSLSLAKLVLVSVTGRFFLKSFRICHMALENSITTKNGDNHVASCGLAASLKIFT